MRIHRRFCLVVVLCLLLTGCTPVEIITPTPTPAPPPPTVGNYIEFGSWREAPIEWQVLAVEQDRYLVITKQPVTIRQYHHESSSVTWEESEVRQWLNSHFFQSSFSPEEQELIHTTELANPDHELYGTLGGAHTQDKVFLLSAPEVEYYFIDETARTTHYTTTADDVSYLLRIAEESWKYVEEELANLKEFLETVTLDKTDQTSWWLRSPGRDTNYASAVLRDGTMGDWEVHLDAGIRPVMWIQRVDLDPDTLGPSDQ